METTEQACKIKAYGWTHYGVKKISTPFKVAHKFAFDYVDEEDKCDVDELMERIHELISKSILKKRLRAAANNPLPHCIAEEMSPYIADFNLQLSAEINPGKIFAQVFALTEVYILIGMTSYAAPQPKPSSSVSAEMQGQKGSEAKATEPKQCMTLWSILKIHRAV